MFSNFIPLFPRFLFPLGAGHIFSTHRTLFSYMGRSLNGTFLVTPVYLRRGASSYPLGIDHSHERGGSLVRVSPLADWYVCGCRSTAASAHRVSAFRSSQPELPVTARLSRSRQKQNVEPGKLHRFTSNVGIAPLTDHHGFTFDVYFFIFSTVSDSFWSFRHIHGCICPVTYGVVIVHWENARVVT